MFIFIYSTSFIQWNIDTDLSTFKDYFEKNSLFSMKYVKKWKISITQN